MSDVNSTEPTAEGPTGAFGGPPRGAVYSAFDVSMRFGDTRALQGVDFECFSGSVHALLGANGAGKSTLVKILAGVQQPDSGRVALDGTEVRFSSGRQALGAGIATVSQELNLFPELSVQENLFLMREPLRAQVVVNATEMRSRAAPIMDRVGLPLSILGRPLRTLSLGARQLVEIARALLENPRVLILDEPTSALKASETRRLLRVVREMRDHNVAVIFVTHFLEDAFDIADVVTVLRGGRVIEAATPLRQLTPKSVIGAMLGQAAKPDAGRDVSAQKLPIPSSPDVAGPLVIDEASIEGQLQPFSMTVEPGEVVGLAGVEGSGPSEILRMLFGDIKLSTGKVKLPSGRPAPRTKPAAVRSGVAYVPADRQANGLILQEPIYENVSMVVAGPLKRSGLMPSRRKKVTRVEAWREAVGLTMSSSSMVAAQLSGGNQQKIVFAKWLETAPTLVLLDDPTRGVDVGAKADMIKIIRAVADSGRVILYSSNDLDEMTRVCDRIYVFYRGERIGELNSSVTEDELLEAVTRGSLRGSQPRPSGVDSTRS